MGYTSFALRLRIPTVRPAIDCSKSVSTVPVPSSIHSFDGKELYTIPKPRLMLSAYLFESSQQPPCPSTGLGRVIPLGSAGYPDQVNHR